MVLLMFEYGHKNGKLDGSWKHWDYDGNLSYEHFYKEGNVIIFF